MSFQLYKIENGQIVLNVAKLKNKQKRNVIALLSKNEESSALNYIKRVSLGVSGRVSALSTIRYEAQAGAVAFNNPAPNRILEKYRRFFNVAYMPNVESIAKGDAVGVEIEFIVPIDNIDAWGDSGCDCDDDECEDRADASLEAARSFFTRKLTELKVKGINIGTDGSLGDYDTSEEIGLEARILTNFKDMSNLEKFCKLLDSVGARVNKTCGLHVHLDCRQYDRKPSAVVKRLVKALPLLKALVPKSRIGNRYCEHDLASDGGERYACINDYAFDDKKTIEVRMHSGTINFTKISNWVTILRSIAFGEGIQNAPVTIESYASKLQWSAQLVAWIVSRIQKFNPNHELLGSGNENPITEQPMLDPSHEASEAIAA